MKTWILNCHIMLAAITLLSLPAAAYTVSPSVVNLNSTGTSSSAFVQLTNKGIKPVAIEFSIHQHTKDIKGNAVRGLDASDDFIIYPAQVVMMPGDEVSVQVLWIGESALKVERAYSLTTNEVAIPKQDQPETGSGVRVNITVLMNYEGRVYVAPQGAKPKVLVETIKTVTDLEDTAMVEVTLVNQGTAHQSFRGMSLVFAPLDSSGNTLGEQAVAIASSNIPAMRPHLLAGTKRRLLVPRPEGLPPGPVSVQLSQ